MVNQELLSASLEQIGDSTTVRLAGEIDMSSVSLLADCLRRAFDKGPLGSITVDLTEVSFIDCAGLRALISAERLARRNDYRVRFKCGAALRRLIEASQPGIACD